MKNKDMKYHLVPVKDCKIKRCGKMKGYVYDLETAGGSHTFFANGILVHNSIYVKMDNVLKKLFNTVDIDWDDKETFAKLKGYVDDKFQKVLNKHVADFICNRFKTPERRIEFKREKISSEGDYIAKKHYAVHVRDDEGIETDKFSYTGVDIAKNELPQKIKDLLKNLVENMMRNHWIGDEKIHPEIMKIYDTYSSLDMNDIAYIKNLKTLKKTEDFLKLEKGAGVHARAAEFYNQIIDTMGLNEKYEKINKDDRFHYIYLKTNNKYGIDCIAWKDNYPKEFADLFEIDLDKMFEKTIQGPLKKFLLNHSASEVNPNNMVVKGKVDLFDL